MRSPIVLLMLLIATALAAALFGCNSGDGAEDSTTPEETTAEEEPTTGEGTAPSGDRPPAKPLGPPKPKESIEQARKRIADVVSSDDCDEINELNPLSRPKLRSEDRCEYLKRLAGLDVLGAKSYGDLGAVIDYERGAEVLSAVLVRDADGLFHVAFIDPFRGTRSVGTKLARQFDKAARQAMTALKKENCRAFLKVAFRRFGYGGGSDKEVCDRIGTNLISALLEANPKAELKRLGGNAGYAFYGLATPSAYTILVMAQQSESGVPEAIPAEIAKLPKKAAEYAYVDAYRVNLRQQPESSGE